jgi:hypothetical protein
LKEQFVFVETLIEEMLTALFSEILCTQAGGGGEIHQSMNERGLHLYTTYHISCGTTVSEHKV